MKGKNTNRPSRRKKSNLYAVILAGGSGTRFWPLSRETSPKQLLKVAGDESLLKSTLARLRPLVPPEDVFIVANHGLADIIHTHLGHAKRDGWPNYIIEPFGRNTAPAICLAALELARKDPDSVMAVLPADHLVGDTKAFCQALMAARNAAMEDHIVTFGIKPASPHTGYGYIKAAGRALRKMDGFAVRKVERFVEKPDMKRARAFLKQGSYFWNSGIFVWRTEKILEELRKHVPDVWQRLSSAGDEAALKEAYEGMEPISIDHGVLEKTGDCVMIEAHFKWSDMGSWGSLKEVMATDRDGNIIKGRVVDRGSRDSIIMGCDRLVATIGLDDMIIVDTPDATLVCPKDRAEEVKDVVGVLKKKGFAEHAEHLTIERPWGSYTVLDTGPGYKIKRILIEPGKRLSLQSHKFRSEHWVVVVGTAEVQRGEETVEVRRNESVYIPRGIKHRLGNQGKTRLEIIEVQNGDYVEEDDIVRHEDDFERG